MVNLGYCIDFTFPFTDTYLEILRSLLIKQMFRYVMDLDYVCKLTTSPHHASDNENMPDVTLM